MSPEGEQLRFVPKWEQSHIAEHGRAQPQVPLPWHGGQPQRAPGQDSALLSLEVPFSFPLAGMEMDWELEEVFSL